MSTPAGGGGHPGSPPDQGETIVMPRRFFWLALTYLAALVALFLAYRKIDAVSDWLGVALGPIPIEAPWFGALGGVLISFHGIYFHNQTWQHSYDDWYYTRPLIAGLTGALGAFIFVVLIRVGANKSSSALAHFDPKQLDRSLLDVIAFSFGFAEARFRDLLDAVFAAIFSPGKAPNTQS